MERQNFQRTENIEKNGQNCKKFENFIKRNDKIFEN